MLAGEWKETGISTVTRARNSGVVITVRKHGCNTVKENFRKMLTTSGKFGKVFAVKMKNRNGFPIEKKN